MSEDLHIKLRDVRKSFGPKDVLNGINLDVPRGESVVIIGGSGSGKSVMLKCILGILQADSGSILVNGKEVIGQPPSDQEEMLRHFGMLFHTFGIQIKRRQRFPKSARWRR